MIERIADRLCRRTAGGLFRKLRFEPDRHRADQRLALGPAYRQSIHRRLAAHAVLNRVKGGDSPQRFHRDRCFRLGQIVEAAADMAPTECQRDGRLSGLGADERLVGLIAIALQDAPIAAEQRRGMDMPSAERVAIYDSGGFAAAPRAVVTSNSPEIALLGPPTSGVEHRHDSLIGEDVRRGHHHRAQPRHHRGELGRRIPDPERQCGAIEDHALPGHHLSLPIQRLMIGKARDRHLRDECLGRQATFDQPRRCGRLHHGTGTGSTGELRSPGHDYSVLHRDNIQPLRLVFADHRHRGPAARARGVVRNQRHLDPRQVGRQGTAAHPPLGRIVLAQLAIALLRLRLALGDRLLESFEPELQLLFR